MSVYVTSVCTCIVIIGETACEQLWGEKRLRGVAEGRRSKRIGVKLENKRRGKESEKRYNEEGEVRREGLKATSAGNILTAVLTFISK